MPVTMPHSNSLYLRYTPQDDEPELLVNIPACVQLSPIASDGASADRLYMFDGQYDKTHPTYELWARDPQSRDGRTEYQTYRFPNAANESRFEEACHDDNTISKKVRKDLKEATGLTPDKFQLRYLKVPTDSNLFAPSQQSLQFFCKTESIPDVQTRLLDNLISEERSTLVEAGKIADPSSAVVVPGRETEAKQDTRFESFDMSQSASRCT